MDWFIALNHHVAQRFGTLCAVHGKYIMRWERLPESTFLSILRRNILVSIKPRNLITELPSHISTCATNPRMTMASPSQQKCARVLSIVASGDIREPEWSHIHLLVSTSAKCATKRLTLVLVNNIFVARSEARAKLFPYVQHYVTTITSLAQTSVESATVAIDVLLFGWSDLQLSAYTWDQVYSNSPSKWKSCNAAKARIEAWRMDLFVDVQYCDRSCQADHR